MEDYNVAGTRFVYVGPLLDKAGAKRAGGFKDNTDTNKTIQLQASSKESDDQINVYETSYIDKIVAAKAEGKQIVYVSMGTVTTGDHPTLGWNGRIIGKRILI
jgi:hypothetical protein